jgi:hypothetical protein
MTTRTARPRPPAKPRRSLLEQAALAGVPTGPALRVDPDAGVIYGVRVLGRYSRNSHGLAEAENGTEYSRPCMESAVPLYEGAKVKCDHPPDRSKPGAERSVDDIFGVLKNVRLESDDDGQPVVRGDLHYRRFHRLTADVLDDVARRLGLWGLSHNATARRERFDAGAKRLVIEELAQVRSVDLVDKPATNRNLWESWSRPVHTLRSLLEARAGDAALSKPRRKWCRRLLEMYEADDAMAPAMNAPPAEDTPAPEADPDAALKGGFDAACNAVLMSDMTADEKIAKLKELLKTHEKLTQKAEPEAPPADATEAEDKPMDKQESEELRLLRGEKAVRQLCESLSVTLSAAQVEAGAALPDAKRKAYVESFKPTGKPAFRAPKSGPAGGHPPAKKDAPRETTESVKDELDSAFRIVRG